MKRTNGKQKVDLVQCYDLPSREARDKFLEEQINELLKSIGSEVRVRIVKGDVPPDPKLKMVNNGKNWRRWFNAASRVHQHFYDEPILIFPFYDFAAGTPGYPVPEESFWRNPYKDDICVLVLTPSMAKAQIAAIAAANSKSFGETFSKSLEAKLIEYERKRDCSHD